jgi:hypothetical protein
MRPLLIIGIVISLLLHFTNQHNSSVETDLLNTRQSSIQRPVIKNNFSQSTEKKLEVTKSNFKLPDVAVEDDLEIMANDDVAQVENDEEFNIPWKEIEEGWRAELKDYLVKNDPDNAEEIFNTYLKEKDAPLRGPALVGAAEENSEGAIVEYSDNASTEDRKEERLQELLGDHYKGIKALHKEYVESIQYLNNSEVKFSIAL